VSTAPNSRSKSRKWSEKRTRRAAMAAPPAAAMALADPTVVLAKPNGSRKGGRRRNLAGLVRLDPLHGRFFPRRIIRRCDLENAPARDDPRGLPINWILEMRDPFGGIALAVLAEGDIGDDLPIGHAENFHRAIERHARARRSRPGAVGDQHRIVGAHPILPGLRRAIEEHDDRTADAA